MINSELLGKLAYSKSGRDAGKYFLIIGIIDDNYVYISDGDLRPIKKPKRKKVMHLNLTNETAEDILKLINSGEMVSNRMVKQYIQSMNSYEEV